MRTPEGGAPRRRRDADPPPGRQSRPSATRTCGSSPSGAPSTSGRSSRAPPGAPERGRARPAHGPGPSGRRSGPRPTMAASGSRSRRSARPRSRSAPTRSSARSPRSSRSCCGSAARARPAGAGRDRAPGRRPAAALTVARELYARDRPPARRPTTGRSRGRPVPFVRRPLLEALDEETRALAIALYARPARTRSSCRRARIVYAIDNCLLTLEADQIEDAIVQPGRTGRRGAPRRPRGHAPAARPGTPDTTKNAVRSIVDASRRASSPPHADRRQIHDRTPPTSSSSKPS